MITASTNSITYLQCTQCQDGLYLLRNQTQNQEFYPEKFTFCTPDCEKSHYAFINDPLTGTCKDCGKFCRSCNNQFGCELCDAEDAGDQGWVNAYDSTSPYSNFKKCQECSNNKYCLICSSSDPTSCSSCASDYSSSCTSYSFESFLDNCLQGVSGSSSSCQMCKDYFFVNQINSCSSCSPLTNCLECDSSYNCEQCEQGFTLVDSSTVSTRLRRNLEFNDNQILNLDQNSNQSNCNKNAENYEKYFSDCASCTQDSSNQSLTVCNGCKNGFFNDGKCVSKCPSGYYGTQDFTERGLISQSYCSQCHSSCEECIGQSSSECTKCGKNKYLELGSYMISYGTCESKTTSTASFTLYVQAADEPSGSDTQSITGQQISDAFYQLDDAIVKSEELCAHVTQKCTVMIYLLNGDHYLLRNARNTYRPLKQDKSHQVIEMTIQPLFCSINSDALCVTDDTHLTIYNKMRDKFNLKMRMIRIHVYHKGQSAALQMIQQLYLQIADPMGAIIMLDRILLAILILQHFLRSMDCQIAQGTSFIEFDLNEHMVLSSSPTLILDNVEFRNFYYDFNSLIELNSYGGNVEITNSVFQSFSQCGSIIRNYKKILSYDSYSTSSANEVQSYQYRNNLLQNQIYNFIDSEETLTFNPFNQSCSLINSDKNPCFSISIKNTIFKQMYHFEQQQITPIKVNSNYGLVHHGKILNLDNFRGNVIIEDSSFLNNQQNFIDCSIAESIYNKESQSATTIFGTKDKFQMRHLISIQNHNFGIYIMNNNFDQNTVINGLVNILLQESQQGIYPTIIYKNTFTKNAAYYDTVGIQLRIQTSNLFQESISDSTLKCTGITVEENSFTYNFGCPAFTGPTLSVECYDPTVASIDERDKLRMNVQISSALIDEYTYTDYSALTATDIHTYSYNSIDIHVDYKKMIIKGNLFSMNLFGNGKGLLVIKGLQRIFIESCSFIKNHENSLELSLLYQNLHLQLVFTIQSPLTKTSIISQFSQQEVYKLESSITNTDLLAKSLIYIEYTNYVQILGDEISWTVLLENNDKIERSNAIMFSSLYGSIEISDTIIHDFYGMYSQDMIGLFNQTFVETIHVKTKLVVQQQKIQVLKIFISNNMILPVQLKNLGYSPIVTKVNAIFQNNTFENIDSQTSGGLINFMNLQYSEHTHINDTFTNVFSKLKGGIIYANSEIENQIGRISIQSSKIYQTSTIPLGTAVYISQPYETTFEIQDSILICNQDYKTANFGILSNFLQNQVTYEQVTAGTPFVIESTQGKVIVYSQDNDFSYCEKSKYGGVFKIQSYGESEITELRSVYQSYMGGSIYLDYDENSSTDTITFDLNGFTAQNSNSLSNGGFLVINGEAQSFSLTIINSNFSEVYSSLVNQQDDFKLLEDGGGLGYLYANSLTLTISNCEFNKIKSQNFNGGLFNIITNISDITISESIIEEVQAVQSGSIINLKSNVGDLKIMNNPLIQVMSSTSIPSLSTTYATIGTAFQIQFSTLSVIYSSNNTYKSCGISSKGGVFNLNQYSNLTEAGSIFLNNYATLGGIYYCDSCYLNIYKSYFTQIKSIKGNIIYAIGDAKVQFIYSNYSLFKNLSQYNGGGVIKLNNANVQVTIQLSQFINNYIVVTPADSVTGGIFQIDQAKSISQIIKDSTTIAVTNKIFQGIFYMSGAKINSAGNLFSSNYISAAGGVFYLNGGSFDDQYSYFVQNSAIMGGVFYAVNTQFTFKHSQFIANFAQLAGTFYLSNYCALSLYNVTMNISFSTYYGGMFYMLLQDTQEIYPKSQSGYLGGVFYILQIGNITIENSKLSDLKTSIYGILMYSQTDQNGVIYFKNSIVECKTYFDYDYIINKVQQSGSDNSAHIAAIGILVKTHAKFVNTKMYNNIAFEVGTLQVDMDVNLVLINLEIFDNFAYNKAGVISVLHMCNMTVNNTIFRNNIVQKAISTVNIFGSSSSYPIVFNNVSFIGNKAGQSTMLIMFGNVTLNNCLFQDNEAEEASKGIFVGFSEVYIYQTTFEFTDRTRSYIGIENHTKLQGTYLNLLVGSKVTVRESSFINGYSYQGGAIYISGQANLTLINNQFIRNRAYTGGAIMAQQFSYILIEERNKFIENHALLSGADIYANSEKINQTISQGGAIYCRDCYQFHLNSSIISNTNALSGGALFLGQTQMNKKSNQKYIISKSQIQNTKSTVSNGGALEIQNVKYLEIIDSSFTDCKASQNGGAIYYTCSGQDCVVKFTNNNTFQNNFAVKSGGAIFWTDIEPIFSNKNMRLLENKANIYADNIGCFPQKLGQISTENQKRQLSNQQKRALEIVQTEISDNSFKSGDIIPTFEMALVDKYGQVVSTDSDSKLTITVEQISSKVTGKYFPIFEGTSMFFAQNGIFTIQGLQFTASPGFKYRVAFSTEAIDKTKESNQEYLEQVGMSQPEFHLDLQLRECIIGERFSDKGSCDVCANGTYYSLTKMTEPGKCTECPTSVAICYGGSFIGPNPGYWRKNNYTQNFISCLNSDACLGMVPPENNMMGSCAEGYQGILCADCKNQYTRDSSYVCTKCQNLTSNIIKIIGIFILVCFLIVLMVRSTIKGAQDRKNLLSVYQKILLNHIQLILLTSNFSYQWTQLVIDFFAGCIDIDGESRNKEDLEILCDSDEHSIWKLFIALPSIIVWGLGIPFFALTLIGRLRNQLETVQARAQFGFLYRGYKREYYYWEILIMYRKIVLIFISVFVTNDGIITQALLIFILLVGVLVYTLKKKPFQNEKVNNIESISIVACTITIFCGIFFILDIQTVDISKANENQSSSSSKEAIGIYLTDGTRVLFFVIILLSHCLFFVLWTIENCRELNLVFLNRYHNMYIKLFLCNNKKKFDKRLAEAKIFEENQILHEQFKNILKKVKLMYKTGSLVLNKNVIERLEFYMRKDHIMHALGRQVTIHTQATTAFDITKPTIILDLDKRKQQGKGLRMNVNLQKQSTKSKLNEDSTLYQASDSSKDSNEINFPQLEYLDPEEWKAKNQIKRLSKLKSFSPLKMYQKQQSLNHKNQLHENVKQSISPRSMKVFTGRPRINSSINVPSSPLKFTINNYDMGNDDDQESYDYIEEADKESQESDGDYYKQKSQGKILSTQSKNEEVQINPIMMPSRNQSSSQFPYSSSQSIQENQAILQEGETNLFNDLVQQYRKETQKNNSCVQFVKKSGVQKYSQVSPKKRRQTIEKSKNKPIKINPQAFTNYLKVNESPVFASLLKSQKDLVSGHRKSELLSNSDIFSSALKDNAQKNLNERNNQQLNQIISKKAVNPQQNIEIQQKPQISSPPLSFNHSDQSVSEKQDKQSYSFLKRYKPNIISFNNTLMFNENIPNSNINEQNQNNDVQDKIDAYSLTQQLHDTKLAYNIHVNDQKKQSVQDKYENGGDEVHDQFIEDDDEIIMSEINREQGIINKLEFNDQI
eukprot:403366887